MPKKSAGVLLYRLTNGILEVLLVHPGGPFWSKKDLGTWSIPKGEFNDEEDPLLAAKREFHEEIGMDLSGDFITLSPVKLKSGKVVYPFAIEGNIDAAMVHSNMFSLEWPPKSGTLQEFPEIDRAAWFDVETSRRKLNVQQAGIVDELINKLGLSSAQFTNH